MKRPVPILILGLALAGCSGLETGNGRDTPILVAALTAGDAAPVDQQGTVFTLATARAGVERIDIDLPDGASCVGLPGLIDGSGGSDSAPHTSVCANGGGSIRLNGPWVVDLVAGTAVPAIPQVHVPAGGYARVDVRFAPVDPDDGGVSASDPLADQTLVATGTAPLDGQATPYELALAFHEDARFEAGDAITLALGDTADVLLELDPSAWFAALPLAECAADGDLEIVGGVLILSDGGGSCSDVEGAIKDAIKASGELRRAP
ncbi:MAG: hypothetical protein EP329_07930 [Deltaproteobacteria bacterium]|nr:MAG: hypothetical protein EP329_07930 [Deltaproteobacteria bacterium]